MTLEEENQQLKLEIAQLHQQVTELVQRVQQLEQRLAQDSHNSSKPPSSDGLTGSPKASKAKSLRQKSGKKSGGQSGHKGHSLQLAEQPDYVTIYAPQRCQHCQVRVDLPCEKLRVKERRQVWDIPTLPLKLEVSEHRVLQGECPHCHKLTHGEFPPQVRGRVQYGSGVGALATYLCYGQLLPLGRTCEILQELTGRPLSQGTLAQMLGSAYTRLEEAEEMIKAGLVGSAVIHNDESGFYIGGQRHWLHVCSNASLTHYGWHKGRGKAASAAMGILPLYKGVSVHDGYASYTKYECDHALCNVHHLRELIFVVEQLGQLWAKELIALLIGLKEEVAVAQRQGQVGLDCERLKYYQAWYDTLIEKGLATNAPPKLVGANEVQHKQTSGKKRGRVKQSKAKNLLDRLQRYKVEVLRFATDFSVPFDNNQGERDIRMLKVQQKISGCFRSEGGASYFCRVRSYLSTMRKQGHSAFKVLMTVFRGDVLLPTLPF